MNQPIHDNKRIAKNTLLLSFRMVVMMAVTLYTSRVVLDQLGVVDFGVYNVVGGIVLMLSFLNSSMTTAVQRYFSYAIGEDDSAKLQQYFNVSMTAHFVISLIVIVLVELVGAWYLNNYMNIPPERMEAANWVLQFSVVSIVFVIMQVPYNSMIIAKEQMGIYAWISIADAVVKLGIAYVLTIIVWDKLKWYAIMMAIVPLMILIIYHYYCRAKFPETKLKKVQSKGLFKEMISFASWNAIGELSWVLTDQGVNLLINYFYGPAINAARAIGVQVNAAVNRFVQNFQVAVNPQIIKLYAAGDVSAMKSLVFQASRFSFYLLLIVCLPLLFVMEDVLALWLKEVPNKAVIFCQLFLICTLIQIIPNLLAQIARAYGKIRKYTTMVTSAIFLIFPLSLLALYEGMAPEVTVVIAICVQFSLIFVRMYLIKGMIGMRYSEFSKSVLWPVFKVSAFSVVLPLALSGSIDGSLLKSFTLVGTSIMCASASSFFVGMTQGERNYIINNVKKRIRR